MQICAISCANKLICKMSRINGAKCVQMNTQLLHGAHVHFRLLTRALRRARAQKTVPTTYKEQQAEENRAESDSRLHATVLRYFPYIFGTLLLTMVNANGQI